MGDNEWIRLALNVLVPLLPIMTDHINRWGVIQSTKMLFTLKVTKVKFVLGTSFKISRKIYVLWEFKTLAAKLYLYYKGFGSTLYFFNIFLIYHSVVKLQFTTFFHIQIDESWFCLESIWPNQWKRRDFKFSITVGS